MNICLDLRPVLPHPTGIGRVAYDLTHALQAIDNDNCYTMLCRSQTFAPISTKSNFKMITCDIGQYSPRMHFEIPRLLKRLKIDVYFSPYFVIPAWLPCPSVVIIHDVIFSIFPDLLPPAKRLVYQLLTKRTLATSAIITTDSDNTRRDLLRCFPGLAQDKVHTAYIAADKRFKPIDDQAVLDSFRARHQMPDQYVCYVGNYKAHKNVSSLISAFALIKDSVKHHLVLLDNKGEECDKIKELTAACGLQDRVYFCPSCSDNDLPFFYNCADAFVFPSLYEGFGLPPLEAMSCGTPVIASATSSLPEVIGDAGLLIAPHDIEGLADAMKNVLTNPDLRSQLREKGLQRARMFTWERCASQMLEFFKTACGKKNR